MFGPSTGSGRLAEAPHLRAQLEAKGERLPAGHARPADPENPRLRALPRPGDRTDDSEAVRGTLFVDHGSLSLALQRLEHRGWIAGTWGASENNRKAHWPQSLHSARTGKRGRARVAADFFIHRRSGPRAGSSPTARPSSPSCTRARARFHTPIQTPPASSKPMPRTHDPTKRRPRAVGSVWEPAAA